MRIVSLNVRGGINKKNKPYKIINYLEKLNFDICLLQETSHIKQKNINLIETKLNVDITQSQNCEGKHHIGVATLINKNTQIKTKSILNIDKIGRGRLRHLKIETNGKNVDVLNIYDSTHIHDKKPQWENISKYLQGIDGENIIIMGDLNSTLNQNDRTGAQDRNHIDKHLKNLLNKHNLTDIATWIDKTQHTFIGYKATSLLDRILITNPLKNDFIEYNNIPCTHSDHNLISINLLQPTKLIETHQKRTRDWKLNTSLLDQETKQKIANLWEEWRLHNKYEENYLQWYIEGKKKVKKLLIKIGKQKAKQRNEKEKHYEQTLLNELKKPIPDFEVVHEAKKEINKIIEYKIQGIIIRTRSLTLPNEEKGSRNFFNLENKHIKQIKLETLINDHNEEIKTKTEIDKTIYNFYKDLYQSTKTSETAKKRIIQSYTQIEEISEVDKENLNAHISLKEVESAISRMGNNKSPGPDGLPKEYYSAMWEHIKYDVLGLMHTLDMECELPPDLTMGTTKLLYKKMIQNT